MTARRPVGQITRGTTAPNRLRRIDRWLIHRECTRLRAADAPVVVDLGYGATPITAWELRERLQQHVRPDLRVIGVEIDPERVTAAQPLADASLQFVRGGFELPVEANIEVVRAANVLRQYDESQVQPAWEQVVSRLAPNGLLIDATCDEIGRLGSWIEVRNRNGQAEPESLTISLHVSSLELPSDVAARLPKALIHRNQPGHRIHDVLNRLDDAWRRTAAQSVFGPRAHWVAAVEYATDQGLAVLDSRARWRLGELSLPWAQVSD